MRKALLVLLLPIVWAPLIALVAVAMPHLPWYAWLVAVLFWVMLAKRRRDARAGLDVQLDPAAARFSPVGRGGGY